MPKAWSYVDFILVFLGGFVGAGVAVAVGFALGDDEALVILGLAGQYVGHVLVLWLLSRGRDGPGLGFSIEGRDVLYIGAGLFLQLSLAVLFLPLANLLLPDGEAQQVGSALSELESSAARLAAILIAVVLAPVTEELMFRGVLLKALKSGKHWVVVTVTAMVFAAFHITGLDPSRFFQAAAIVLPQLLIVGLVLAWITLRTKRLGPAIFIHSGFNLVAAVVLLLPEEVWEGLV